MQTNAAEPTPPPNAGKSSAAAGAFLTGALGAGMLASCCGVPLLLGAIGLGTSGAALFVAEWRYPLLAVCFLSMLASGIYLFRRRAVACDSGCSKPTLRRSQAVVFVGIALSVSLGGAGMLLARPSNQSPSSTTPTLAAAKVARVEIPVRGLSCAGCSGPIRSALNAITPIEQFEVDVPNGLVRFSVSEDRIDMAAFRRAIEGLGYSTDKARLAALH